MIDRIFLNKLFLFVLLIFAICYSSFVTSDYKFEPEYSLYHDSVALAYLNSANSSVLVDLEDAQGSVKNQLLLDKRYLLFNSIYGFFLNYFSLNVAAKIISIVLWLVSSILIYKIGVLLKSGRYGVLLVGMFLIYFLSMDTFYGGGFRTFGAFILILFIYLFMKGKLYVLPVLIPVMSLFYPYLCMTLTIVCFIVPTVYHDKICSISKYCALLGLSVAMSLFLIIGLSSIGGSMSIENLSAMGTYKYYYNVQSKIIPSNPMHFIAYFVLNLNEHSSLYVLCTMVLMVFCSSMLLVKRQGVLNVPKQIWITLLSSFIGFIFLYFILPIAASRQVIFVLPLFLCFLSSENLFVLANGNKKKYVSLFLAGMLYVLLAPGGNDISNKSRYKAIYDYTKTLEKGGVIAGSPRSELVDTIPFYTDKEVFYLDRTRDLFLSAYGQEGLKERRAELITAMYADSLDEVVSFAMKNKIESFVVEEEFYKRAFLMSLNSSIKEEEREMYSVIERTGVGLGREYALLEFAKKNADFYVKMSENKVYVVNVKSMTN